MKRKPPVHKGQRALYPGKMDMYNPSEIQSSLLPPMNPNDQRQRSHQNNNMAYINVASDGAKPVGGVGLKRAEKDLIMRRYKNNYH